MVCRGAIRTPISALFRSLSLMQTYKSSHLRQDPAQMRVVEVLDKLLHRLEASPSTCKGVYLHGSVGSGKTLLMDLFFGRCSAPKRRTHFHKFMLEVHQRIHLENQRILHSHGRAMNLRLDSRYDAVANVALQLSQEFRVLCFDEFQITDIADAWILSRLFVVLWERGTVLVTTSNRHCDDLYENGINRAFFLPFIETLKQRCLVIHLNSPTDYRLAFQGEAPEQPSYYVPLSPESSVQLFSEYLDLARRTNDEFPGPISIQVMMRRHLHLPSGLLGQVCWCTFEGLCSADRGAADYKALCSNFHTIFLDGACCCCCQTV